MFEAIRVVDDEIERLASLVSDFLDFARPRPPTLKACSARALCDRVIALVSPKAKDALVAHIPVGRIAVPEDIWLAIKFVLECDYFNGRCIDVDGGLSM